MTVGRRGPVLLVTESGLPVDVKLLKRKGRLEKLAYFSSHLGGTFAKGEVGGKNGAVG